MITTINNKHNKLNFSSEREQSQACLNSAEHEKNQGRKVLNVPNLRFPEFQGEWEKCKLGDYGKVVTGNTPPTKDIENYENGTYLWASPADLGTIKSISVTKTMLSAQGFSKTRKLPKGSVLVTCIGSTIGKTGMATKEMSTNQQINSIVVNDSNDNEFVYYAIQSAFPRYLSSIAVQAVPIISKSAFELLPNKKPCLQEQKKIGKFLSLLDQRIATQNKIIEDLKMLKSAIIEKVFCSPNQKNPMCRIEGFEQTLSTYKMSDFSSRIATKNKDSKCSLVLTIAAQYGLVNQESFFNKSVASENLTGYYLLHRGEFAYNRSYSAGYDWGAVKRLDNYDEGVLSTLYICFKINETIVDSDYLAYYFESTKWHKGLSDIAGEGARNHGLLNVSITDYFNTKHRFPVIEEQKAIAKMLNTITEKERKATLLGECYQKQKQYLLRQMFI
jgi:type I restriction enzyme S subunit